MCLPQFQVLGVIYNIVFIYFQTETQDGVVYGVCFVDTSIGTFHVSPGTFDCCTLRGYSIPWILFSLILRDLYCQNRNIYKWKKMSGERGKGRWGEREREGEGKECYRVCVYECERKSVFE